MPSQVATVNLQKSIFVVNIFGSEGNSARGRSESRCHTARETRLHPLINLHLKLLIGRITNK
jgi:hypothetical protein